MEKLLQRILVVWVLFCFTFSSLVGCTLESASLNKVSKSEVRSRVARVIDEELEDTLALMIAEGDVSSLVAEEARALSGSDLVSRAIEVDGEEYVDFAYQVIRGESKEEILSSSKKILSSEDYEYLVKEVEAEELRMREYIAESTRNLTMKQQKALYQDLKKLVVKSTVLLAAGIVYACIPKTVVWGKVSAACAVAIAAGVVASGICTIIEYRTFGLKNSDPLPSFEAWLESIYKDSYGAWAIAATMISTGNAAKKSPVVTGLIIAAFSLYGVLKDIRPILKKYNFSI